MDIIDRLKIARDIQDKCLIYEIECEVKTTFHCAGEWEYNNYAPYVSIWIYPENKSETSFSLYLWNDDEDIEELDNYKNFMDKLEKLINK